VSRKIRVDLTTTTKGFYQRAIRALASHCMEAVPVSLKARACSSSSPCIFIPHAISPRMTVVRYNSYLCFADMRGLILALVSCLVTAVIGELHFFSHLLGNNNISQGI